jgi:hypothetical protein
VSTVYLTNASQSPRDTVQLSRGGVNTKQPYRTNRNSRCIVRIPAGVWHESLELAGASRPRRAGVLQGSHELLTGAGQQTADQAAGHERFAGLHAAHAEAVVARIGPGGAQAAARAAVRGVVHAVAAAAGEAARHKVVVTGWAVRAAAYMLG